MVSRLKKANGSEKTEIKTYAWGSACGKLVASYYSSSANILRIGLVRFGSSR